MQGSGAAEAAAAMARWGAACDRLAKVARLSCSTAAKGTFAAAAAMSAGVSATSCQEQPGKVMETMRRGTRHVVWRGGPAADYRLLLGLGVVPASADPVLAGLLAVARVVSLLIQDGHFAVGQLSWLWLAADKANPVIR